MPEVINANLEKAFFTYILQHSIYFDKIEPDYFQNDAIQFIYKIVQEEFLNSKVKYVPEPKQIATMVRNHDPEFKFSNEIITTILKNDNTEFNEEYLTKKFKAWRISNKTKNTIHTIIDDIREMNEIDYDSVVTAVGNIKTSINEISINDDDDVDEVADFDDPEVHKQDLATNKISTGYPTLDNLMGGGWDVGTFNVLMGETSVGKCISYDTFIKIRNKKTNEILNIKIGDFMNELKK
jgi:hypothetical protein